MGGGAECDVVRVNPGMGCASRASSGRRGGSGVGGVHRGALREGGRGPQGALRGVGQGSTGGAVGGGATAGHGGFSERRDTRALLMCNGWRSEPVNHCMGEGRGRAWGGTSHRGQLARPIGGVVYRGCRHRRWDGLL